MMSSCISLQQTKLETRNLVCALIVGPSNQKCKSRSKGDWPASRDLLLWFWNPLYISGTGTDRDFKFGMRIDRQAYIPKKCKSRSKEAWSTSRDLLLLILGPLHNSRVGAARYFKFGVPIDRQAYKPKKCKITSKGAWPASRDLLL